MKMKLSDIQKQKKAMKAYGADWKCPECKSTSFKCYNRYVKEKGIKRVRICKCGMAFDTFEYIKAIRRKK
jgi:hypothetical protein